MRRIFCNGCASLIRRPTCHRSRV